MLNEPLAQFLKSKLQKIVEDMDTLSPDEIVSRLNTISQYLSKDSANMSPYLENNDGIVSKLCDNESDRKICLAKRHDGDITVAILPAHMPYAVGTMLFPERFVDFRLSGGRNDEASFIIAKLFAEMEKKQ